MKWLLIIIISMNLLGCLGGTENPVGPGQEHHLELISGNEQVGFQTKPLPTPLLVRVTDEEGHGVPDLQLAVTITEGDGKILNTAFKTDADGQLGIDWQLGMDLDHALTVSLEADASQRITATAQASYLYRQPEAIGDGWVTGTLDFADARKALLSSAVDDIRSGRYSEIHSLLIVKNSALVFETYFPGHDSQGRLVAFDRALPHEVQSASKSFRSAMIGIAMDHGFIAGVDESLFSFFPEYADLSTGEKNLITLEHILTMSSGLSWDESGAASGQTDNTLSMMYRLPASQWAHYVLSRPMAYAPGRRFVYNTGASILLNQMVMNASTMPMESFVKQFYADLVQSEQIPGIGYPLHASILPRDMAKLGQIFIQEGKWKDRQIVSNKWVEQSCRRHVQVTALEGYGYQWWLRTFQTAQGDFEACYAAGNGGQFIFVVKELDLVVVFTGGNFGSATMYQVYGMMERDIIPAMR